MLRFEFRLTFHVVYFMLFLVSGINCPDIGKYRHSSVDRHRRHADRGAVNKKDSGSFEGLDRNDLYDSSVTGRTAKL
jgi:hypothetical protein